MVRNSQLLVPSFRPSELRHVLEQVFLLPRFEDYRFDRPRGIPFQVIPSVVVHIQVRLYALSFDMGLHDVIDEVPQESSISSERSERERLDASTASFVSVLRAREPHLKRSAAIPEPVLSRCRNHRNPLVAHGCIQVDSTNSLQKALIQKPLLYPRERSVIVLHRDHHGGLA